MPRSYVLLVMVSISLLMAPQVCFAQVVELVEEAQNAQNVLKYDEAEKFWRQVIQLQQNDATAHARLGSVLFSQDKFDEGVAAYQQALKIKPSAKIYTNYGDGLRDKDKLVEAIGAYQEALKLDSKNLEALTGLGLVYNQQENYPEAIVEFRKVIALKPSANNYELLGDALAGMKKFDEAIAAYRQALKKDKNYTWLYIKVAETFYKQSKVNDAIATYRQAIDADSSNFSAYTGLAETVKFPRSVTILTEYVKQDPKNDVPFQALGYVFKENKKLNESVAAYRQAIKVKPSAENYSSLGEVLVEQNKLNEAVAVYHQAIQIDENDYHYGLLAEVLVKQNRLNDALRTCQNVIELKDVFYRTYYACSIAGFGIYEKQGLKNVMTSYQQLATKIAPKDMAEAYVSLGYRITSSDNFNKQDAIAVFEEALKLNPNHKQAQEKIKELQETQETGFLHHIK
jgi:tetratricopeptide (TPR) repeat protein